MAEERERRRRAREMAWREPILLFSFSFSSSLVAFSALLGRVVAMVPFVSVDGVAVAAPSSLVCVSEVGRGGMGERVWEGWTSHGNQPPGAWVIFAFSRPRRRGIEGPVRSMSRIPTEWPARDSESASWVVMDDLPTPPLPDSTWDFCEWGVGCCGRVGGIGRSLRAQCA